MPLASLYQALVYVSTYLLDRSLLVHPSETRGTVIIKILATVWLCQQFRHNK